jgi:Major Facilitator Superfamily
MPAADRGAGCVRRTARLAADAVATPDLRRLQAAWALAAVGGWAFMVALAVHAYATGGAAAVGLAALVRMLPAGLAAPLLGLAADRWNRRNVLLAACLARAATLGVAAAAVHAGAPFGVLLVLATLFTVVATAHKPAQAALLPQLAPDPRRQAAANALWSAIDNGSFVVGAIGGGLLVATLGTPAAFAASGLVFAAAGSLLARIRTAPRRVAGRGAASLAAGDARPPGAAASLAAGDGRPLGGAASLAAGDGRPLGGAASPIARDGCAPRGAASRAAGDVLGGLRAVAADGRLRLLVGVLSASTLIEGMVDVLLVITALRLVDLGDAGVGWLNAAWGVGGLAGGALALGLIARGRLNVALPAGGLLVGLPLLALAAYPTASAALALLAVLGIGYALVEVAGLTLLQRLAADAVRARAFAVVESSYWLTTGAGAMLAPPVVALAGPRGALAIVGAALPLVVLARWAALAGLTAAPAAPPAPPARVAVSAPAPARAATGAYRAVA